LEREKGMVEGDVQDSANPGKLNGWWSVYPESVPVYSRSLWIGEWVQNPGWWGT